MFLSREKGSTAQALAGICLCLLLFVGICDVLRHCFLGALQPVLTMLMIQVCFALIAITAYQSRQPWWMVLPCAGAITMFVYMNNPATTLYNSGLLVTAAISGIWAVLGEALMLVKKEKHGKLAVRYLMILAALLLAFLLFWGVSYLMARNRSGAPQREIWGVPARWDTASDVPEGTVEEFFYETRAYATDGRSVQKSALVYLPAGYSPDKPCDILYLMHGSGDDQYYWLRTHSYNKTMLDQLIAAGEIPPMIVVTPTFYTEDDCTESVAALEGLTYAFREELRNDLVPAVETKYATYAATRDSEGFTESRDHRAFAGLSRGAVTTYRSVLCGCLDWFSYFGTFSGSRTDKAYLTEHLLSEEFKGLTINYLYAASGNLDFALPRQLTDYAELLEIDSRLQKGENTCFDIFPMRYHSMGNWHLALYNFLQHVF